LVDAIVDITETGNSLRANNLRIVDELMQSYPQFVAKKESWEDPWKREKIERMAVLLQGALTARDMVGLKMNLPDDKREAVLEKLPSLRKPTVSRLAQDGWVALEVVLTEMQAREMIPQLKELGAEGIIEYPLNKVIG
jgi:ATP phosphoribosyltransferase